MLFVSLDRKIWHERPQTVRRPVMRVKHFVYVSVRCTG